MSALKDLTGQRFGRYTVISRAENTDRGLARWVCKCDCGNIKTVRGSSLRNHTIVSCGCHKNEGTVNRSTKHGQAPRNHASRLYNVWCGMRERCNNPKATNYKDYGGRGIAICDEWNDYLNFEAWAMNNGYQPLAPRGICTLDRIDVNGNYSPSNCRWVDMKVQGQNQRRNAS